MYKKTSYPGETPRLDYIENYEKGELQGMTYVYDQYGQKIIERARYVDWFMYRRYHYNSTRYAL